jgi:hypothetical protein
LAGNALHKEGISVAGIKDRRKLRRNACWLARKPIPAAWPNSKRLRDRLDPFQLARVIEGKLRRIYALTNRRLSCACLTLTNSNGGTGTYRIALKTMSRRACRDPRSAATADHNVLRFFAAAWVRPPHSILVGTVLVVGFGILGDVKATRMKDPPSS